MDYWPLLSVNFRNVKYLRHFSFSFALVQSPRFLYALGQRVCVCLHCISMMCGHPELLSVTITHDRHYHDKPAAETQPPYVSPYERLFAMIGDTAD